MDIYGFINILNCLVSIYALFMLVRILTNRINDDING